MQDNKAPEMIDICNEYGAPTGMARPRTEVHALGLWHRTVHVWILDHAGKALLQQRSLRKENHPGLWDISSAGHIDAGESSLQAALREVSEELGLALEAGCLVKIGENADEQILLEGAYIDREFHDIYVAHIAPVQLEQIRFRDGEVQAIRWLTGPAMERELREHPETFAPHPTEYPRILRMLGAGLAKTI